MHDMAIYNRALSSNEVAVNYLSTEFVTTVPYPDLLYYKMTEYGQANLPLVLSNSAMSGVANGTVWNTNGSSLASPDWVGNPGGYLSAIHLHGLTSGLAGTQINTYDSTNCNFTNNPYTINVCLGAYGDGYYFMGNDNYTNNGWYLSENGTNSTQLRFGGETYTNDQAIITDNGPDWGAPTNWPGEWSMVTITFDGSNNLLIYLNAALQSTINSFASPAPSTNYLIFGLGKASTNGLSGYDGDMWLPQIWNTNLAPSHIANLFHQQKYGIPWP
jgi:hypothetical protein